MHHQWIFVHDDAHRVGAGEALRIGHGQFEDVPTGDDVRYLRRNE